MSSEPHGLDLAAVERLVSRFHTLKKEISKVIVGQERVVDELLLAIFARGHCILEGVPGLAKTLLVRTLARCLRLDFSRIQFTPDLMPADITGTEVIHEDRASGNRTFRFLKGPIFANVILADEINRTPPKTQAALLEAMQERQVTVGGQRHVLPDPFFVLATQNPIEQEGTYPLPEAQQDRFMFKIYVKYPTWQEEMDVVRQTTEENDSAVEPIFGGDEIQALQGIVRRVPVSDAVLAYALKLARQTRLEEAPAADAPEFVREYVAWGAGPRACQYLILGAKAKALLSGRHHVAVEDVRSVAHAVLRHRILTNFHAEARGFGPDKIIDRLLEITPAEEGAILPDGQLRKILRS
ncbi:MAG TPA: AAA family ATPase [Planctomycetota bacterium]|nr:AAA family ATPase [Planctomycetota bacterium]